MPSVTPDGPDLVATEDDGTVWVIPPGPSQADVAAYFLAADPRRHFFYRGYHDAANFCAAYPAWASAAGLDCSAPGAGAGSPWIYPMPAQQAPPAGGGR